MVAAFQNPLYCMMFRTTGRVGIELVGSRVSLIAEKMRKHRQILKSEDISFATSSWSIAAIYWSLVNSRLVKPWISRIKKNHVKVGSMFRGRGPQCPSWT